MNCFDKNNRKKTTRTHDRDRLVICICLDTKLKENVQNLKRDNNNNNNFFYNNTCSCLECGETPTKREGEMKQNTRRNDN